MKIVEYMEMIYPLLRYVPKSNSMTIELCMYLLSLNIYFDYFAEYTTLHIHIM